MGFGKYFEDNERITIERKYLPVGNIPSLSKKIFYDCYYCGETYDSISDRNNHIRRNHNVAGPLLFINEKIVTDEYYIDVLYSSKIVLCGFNDIEISIDNQRIKNNNAEINLMSYFKKVKDFYAIKIGQKIFTIYRYGNINITNSFIDDVIKIWENQTNKDETLNPSPINYPKSLNKAELTYLNGFFDYFTACKNHIPQTEKKNRYESAFAILSSFSKPTQKTRVLLKIISFRLNWIEKLENLSKSTKGVFDLIIDFYYERVSEKFKNEDFKKNEQLIFVETDIANCFDAIIAYQKDDFVAVDHYLANWQDNEKIEEIKDINLKDRILLLKARQMKKSGNYIAAKKYYENIKTPFIKKEALNFIKNH